MAASHDMSPSLAAGDQGYRGSANAKVSRQCLQEFATVTATAYLDHLGLSQFVSAPPFTARDGLGLRVGAVALTARTTLRIQAARVAVPDGATALRGHIGAVVSNGAEKKVGRIDTGWVVAVVQNPQPIRNGAVVDFPRNTMRPNRTPVLASAAELSIAARLHGCGPSPAAIGLANLRPEAGSNSSCTIRVHSEPPIPRAVPPVVDATRGLRAPQFYHSYQIGDAL